MQDPLTEAAAVFAGGCALVLIWAGAWLTIIGLAALVVRRVFFGH
jgi:hypothetical protein